MKAKNNALLDRYDLYNRGIWKKPQNYQSFLDEVKRRIGWKVDIIRLCDNWDKIVSTDRKALSEYCNPKKFHFPKKRSVPSKVFDPKYSMRNVFHIVKKKNNRYKIVRNKSKKPVFARTLVIDTKMGYIRDIRDKVWYHPDFMDWGCDTCVDYGICRCGRCEVFCAVAARCGIRCGNTWLEVRE